MIQNSKKPASGRQLPVVSYSDSAFCVDLAKEMLKLNRELDLLLEDEPEIVLVAPKGSFQ